MKRQIKLTENELRSFIKECVTKTIKEASTQPYTEYDDEVVGSKADKDSQRFYQLWHKQNDGQPLTKKEQEELSWLQYRYGAEDGETPDTYKFNPRGKDRLNTVNYATDTWDQEKGYTDDGTLYPQVDYIQGYDSHKPWQKDMEKREVDDFHHKFDNYLDRLKYSKQADSRKLHRKGSLNRAFEESKHRAKVRRIVKECIGY